MLRTRLLCSINRAQENCSVDLEKKQQILVSTLCMYCWSAGLEHFKRLYYIQDSKEYVISVSVCCYVLDEVEVGKNI